MPKRLTQSEFICKAIAVHGHKYWYYMSEYSRSADKVTIVCPEHGEFRIKANNFLNGQGCKSCGLRSMARQRRKSEKEFEEDAKKIFPGYSYKGNGYSGVMQKVKVTCPIHGEFKKVANKLLQGEGCPRCAIERGASKIRKTRERFIQEAEVVHPGYDFSKVEYTNNNVKVSVICPKHGVFWASPSNILGGKGCPQCKESKGEKAVAKYLEEQGVVFECQKSFENLKKKTYDFFLPKEGVLIEFDGIQHRTFVPFFHGKLANFAKQTLSDFIKSEYAENNGYKLIRIQDIGDIESVLGEELDATVA